MEEQNNNNPTIKYAIKYKYILTYIIIVKYWIENNEEFSLI